MPPVLSKEKHRWLSSHETSRKTCCALCLCERGGKATRLINETDEKLIREKVSQDYSLLDLCYAVALCTKCHLDLYKKGEGTLYLSESFGQRIQRSPNDCRCVLCSRAALNGAEWLNFRRRFNEKNKRGRGRPGREIPRVKGSRRANGRATGNAPGQAPRGPGPAHQGPAHQGPAHQGPEPDYLPPDPALGPEQGPELGPEPGPSSRDRRGAAEQNRRCFYCFTEVIFMNSVV